ncbi:ribosomal lysine N-methyltransferase 3 isoform X2 [Daucus carota subsp. sativus]|uniref:ribosomal lysine N-methyltransferase 3 isoform X2 n=1 Tax=Daucus carota subsp. sativus TaxID=79200 RepID=UPI0007EEF949|nr:PREDICTED: ribosomal lysine N-methyltransferase 3 isoform X2 [Daucus carota subsp. sativus]
MSTRPMRAFKRWMKLHGINYIDALRFIQNEENDAVWVKTVADLHQGDLVATIPKQSCLTMKTSGARHVIEEAGLDGYLGLSVALMYEKSLGPDSPWFAYLQLMPQFEPIPLLWSFDELDLFLSGTELHKIVKEDRALINEDWKECISPLFDSATGVKLNPDDFSVEQYLMAKSLIASRSFEIDDYHGFGMVPLADLFNHKTDAEDVHFTSVASHSDSEEDSEISDDSEKSGNDSQISNNGSDKKNTYESNINDVGSELNNSDDPAVLQMIIVKEVEAGAEVFNTYGSMGNAALLHRYGFTEPENPYDIVNIDLELVLRWSSSLYSSRYSRSRVAFWKKLDYSGCLAQNSEYFEISSDGKPEIELLVLLFVMSLSEDDYGDLSLQLSSPGACNKLTGTVLSKKVHVILEKGKEMSKNALLTNAVRSALIEVADLRDRLYGSRSLEDDIKELSECCFVKERKLYHSLVLRISERRILQKLRAYASSGLLRNCARGTKTKKLKVI